MLKRVFKETVHSMKRNPVKVVLIGLIMFISANLLFASILIQNGILKEISDAHDYLGRQIKLEYIDPSLEVFNFEREDDSPILYSDDMPIVDELYSYEISSSELLRTLGEVDYKHSIYTLGLFPGFNQEVNSDVSSTYQLNYLNLGVWYGDGSEDNENYVIIDGDNPKEHEANVIIISEGLALEHGLSVGDIMNVNMGGKKNNELLIKGIYRKKNEKLNDLTFLTTSKTFENVIHQMDAGGNFNPALHPYQTELISNVERVFENKSDLHRFLDYVGDSSDYTNMKWVVKTSEIETLEKDLMSIVYILLVIELLIIVTTIVLIYRVIKKDMNTYHQDVINGIYKEDKKRLKRVYFTEVMIITVLTMLLSIYTAPSIPKLISKDTIHSYVKLEEPNESFYKQLEYFNDDKNNPEIYVVGESNNYKHINYYDHYMIANMSFDSDLRSVSLLIITMILTTFVSTEIASRKVTNKKEVIN